MTAIVVLPWCELAPGRIYVRKLLSQEFGEYFACRAIYQQGQWTWRADIPGNISNAWKSGIAISLMDAKLKAESALLEFNFNCENPLVKLLPEVYKVIQ